MRIGKLKARENLTAHSFADFKSVFLPDRFQRSKDGAQRKLAVNVGRRCKTESRNQAPRS